MESLLNLNYPQDKLQIFLVDDGSTDNTWQVIQKFTQYKNIKIFKKENGGKHTAVNLGLENSVTDFFGCLDADSYADGEALARIMSYFEKDPVAMAVVPSVIVGNPKNFIQNAQKAEYHMVVYSKKMLGFLGAINVAPGPFTIFRKKVFQDLGPYHSGHGTEDMEIAFRMQKNNYKIDHCNDAFVYTNTPRTFKKLFWQRVRWVYGFINNSLDYRSLLFKKKYGHFATFTLPLSVLSTVSFLYFIGQMIYNFIHFIYLKIIQLNLIGFHPKINHFVFDPFFINLKVFTFLGIVLYLLTIFAVIFGRKMTQEKNLFSFKILYLVPVLGIITPLSILKGFYNTILAKKPVWRQGINSNY